MDSVLMGRGLLSLGSLFSFTFGGFLSWLAALERLSEENVRYAAVG